MNEFKSFKKGSVYVTENTSSLIRQFTDDTKLIVTTIQKLGNAIIKAQYEYRMGYLRDKRIVFISDD